MFNFRPELMLGDDAEADDMTYEREESDDEGGDDDDAAAAEGKENGVAAKKTTVKNIDLDEFTFDMDGVRGRGRGRVKDILAKSTTTRPSHFWAAVP